MMKKDNAQSRLADGTLVRKDDVRMEAVGTIDELSSHIGCLATEVPEAVRSELCDIQRKLFAVAAVASQAKQPALFSEPDAVKQLHERMQEWNEQTGGFCGFILPGGCRAAAQAHVCRSVCRRAERRLISLSTNQFGIAYMNALSAYFFAMALFLNNIYETHNIKL